MKIIIKENIQKVIKSLEDSSDNLKDNLPLQMFRALTLLKAATQQNIRTRSGLRVRTGTLLNSIQIDIEQKGNQVKGTIGPENVPYAAVHEFGHDFPERTITPRNAKALRWKENGEVFFSKRNKIPAFRVPARPYLGPAVDDNMDKILEKFGLFIQNVMEVN